MHAWYVYQHDIAYIHMLDRASHYTLLLHDRMSRMLNMRHEYPVCCFCLLVDMPYVYVLV